MQKRSSLLMASLFVATALHSKVSFAAGTVSCDLEQDRCSAKPLEPAESDKSLFLGDQLNDELEKLYEKNKALGKETKVVLIARMGQNMKKFKILKDKDGQESLQDMISRMTEETRQNSRSESSSPNMSETISYQTLLNNVNKNDNMTYSHLGIAFRNFQLKAPQTGEAITGEGTGKWAFYHLLYSCDKPEYLEVDGQYVKRSHIFKGTTHSFFFDHLAGYGAQVIVPTQEIQNNLEDMLLKKRQVYNFQTDQYNAAAKFQDLTQQNSNQFVLEAIAAAMRPDGAVTSRAQAIEVLKETGFAPSRITPTGLYSALKIGFVQNLMSNIMPTVCLKTQPELSQYGVAEIVTSNSVVNWMKRNKIVDEIFETGLPKEQMKAIDKMNKSQEEKTRSRN